MHNWEALVGSRLNNLRLCAETQRDIVREVASHFEDIYDDARERGASDAGAREQALGSVGDWRRFAADVKYEKETFMTMTPFRRKVIVPGLVGLVFYTIALWITSILHAQGAQYVFHTVTARTYYVYNVPWLLALPLAGAVGAWLSWRQGGNARQRLAAGILPALTFAWVPLLGLVTAVAWLIMSNVSPYRVSDHAGVVEWTLRIGSLLVPWVVAPALSMAVGTVPFLGLRSPQATPPAEAVRA